MKKILLSTTAALVALAFDNPTSDSCEVVFVKGADGEPLRINKSDFDADQADGGAKQYTLHKGKLAPEQTTPAAELPPTAPPMAAPSAPDFSSGEGDQTNIDPLKNAVAPEQPGPNSRLVIKKNKKYHAVDEHGADLTLDGINNPYDTEDGAWADIRRLPSP